MKITFKRYINQLISNLPVSIFFFTIVFTINLLYIPDGYKIDYGIGAVDELVSIYLFYLIRTVAFAFLVTAYGFIFLSKKLSYRQMIITHAVLVLTSVVLVFRHPSESFTGVLFAFGIGVIIYGVIWFFILFKEKQFLNDANDILKDNDKDA